MKKAKVVSKEQWLDARLQLLKKEKAHSRARDELTRARQQMPWAELDKEYVFEGPDGKEPMISLFADKDQLIVYHFMFGADWEEGCKSCSFVADHYEPSVVHIAHRDVSLVTISRAPWQKLEAYKKLMGWTFRWLSSADSDFNIDFNVSFTDEQIANSTAYYNYRENVSFPSTEGPGISVFARDDDNKIYHTYSAYARGLENFIGAYHLLDIVPKGRDEDSLTYGMEWLRHKDRY